MRKSLVHKAMHERDAFVPHFVLLMLHIPKTDPTARKKPIFLIEKRAIKTDINSIKHCQASLNYFSKKPSSHKITTDV